MKPFHLLVMICVLFPSLGSVAATGQRDDVDCDKVLAEGTFQDWVSAFGVVVLQSELLELSPEAVEARWVRFRLSRKTLRAIDGAHTSMLANKVKAAHGTMRVNPKYLSTPPSEWSMPATSDDEIQVETTWKTLLERVRIVWLKEQLSGLDINSEGVSVDNGFYYLTDVSLLGLRRLIKAVHENQELEQLSVGGRPPEAM